MLDLSKFAMLLHEAGLDVGEVLAIVMFAVLAMSP